MPTGLICLTFRLLEKTSQRFLVNLPDSAIVAQHAAMARSTPSDFLSIHFLTDIKAAFVSLMG